MQATGAMEGPGGAANRAVRRVRAAATMGRSSRQRSRDRSPASEGPQGLRSSDPPGRVSSKRRHLTKVRGWQQPPSRLKVKGKA